MMFDFLLQIFFIFVGPFVTDASISTTMRFQNQKYYHMPITLSRSQILEISDLTNVNHMGQILDNICVVRIVGTPEHTKVKNNDISLMFIFFDGEEAFKEWGPKDSIYGARHLAKIWHDNYTSYNEGENISELDKIDILVLLDLIGAPDPMFYNYFSNTEKWYSLLMAIESNLAALKKFESYSYEQPTQRYFQPHSMEAHIEDDHIPFLQRDIPILHLIPYPFPKVWHKPSDHCDNIDIKTTENINKILRIFVASYLHISM
ncbi:glutaminyl-peptide cyclotransferase isoform X2 [Megachile rotundata]|uniref:glutaminyl-peptide cyclotransferase isoform X2 n=1 Tax=Megachile rotundata TaxID=143995 RepID=UPI000614BA65|nr:PREDICTED: glutaminyl-peptide cyclotransferase-like isoform X2 [Megachile rotundata]